MMKIFTFCLLFLFSYFSCSEKYYKDKANESPYQYIENSADYLEKADFNDKPYVIFYLAKSWFELKNNDQVGIYLKELEDYLKSYDNNILLNDIYAKMAFQYMLAGYEYKAKSMLLKAEISAKKITSFQDKHKALSVLHFYQALVTSKEGYKDQALKYYFKANEEYSNIANVQNDKIQDLGHSIATNISDAFIDRRDLNKALFYSQLALKRRSKNNLFGATYMNLGAIYSLMGKQDSALFYYKKSIFPLRQERIIEYVNESFDSIKSIYYKKKDYKMGDYYAKLHENTLKQLDTIDNIAIQKKQDAIINTHSNILYYIAVLLIVIILTSYYVFKKYKNTSNTVKNTANAILTTPITEEISERSNIQDNSSEIVIDNDKISELHLQLYAKLNEYEKTEFYLDADVTLAKVAFHLHTSSQTISEVINKNKQVNFSTYINTLRVNYIMELLKNEPRYRAYKISYLCTVCGFLSHSNFTKVFKNLQNMSPSEYINILNAEEGK